MARRHFLAGYRVSTTVSDVPPETVANEIEAFGKQTSDLIDLQDDRRVFQISEVRRNGLSLEIKIGTGHYGTQCKIVDRNSGSVRHDRAYDHADLIGLHAVFDLSHGVPVPLAVFHKFGQLGARTSFEQALNEFLSTRQEFKVRFTPIAPASALREWTRQGRVARIQLHKRYEATSHLGELAIHASIQPSETSGKHKRKNPPPKIDETLSFQIRWGYGQLPQVLGKALAMNQLNAAKVAEFVGNSSFNPTEADITLGADGRERTFRVGAEFRVAEDITRDVEGIRDPSQISKVIFIRSREYIAQLAQLQ
jgi:hypothetical protein